MTFSNSSRRIAFSLAVILAVLGSTASAGTFFVSTTGNDTNPGTITAPWRSLYHATASALPGDTVFFRGGEYHEILRTQRSGTESQYIVFKAYPGERVVIDGPADGDLAVAIIPDNYIVIEGFTFLNQDFLNAPGKTTFWVSLEGKYIIFRYNRLYSFGDFAYNLFTLNAQSRGIVVYGTHITVEHCYVRGVDFGIMLAGPAPRYAVISHDTVNAVGQNCIDVGAPWDASTAYHATLIEHCVLDTSYMEDNIQFEPNYSDPSSTLFNRGTVIRFNRMGNAAENVVDLKGAEHAIIDGNLMYGSLGDDDGPLGGHDALSGAAVETSPIIPSKNLLVRRNLIWDCNAGAAMGPGDHYYNNTLLNNRRTWEGPSQSTGTFSAMRTWNMPQLNRAFVNNIIGGQPNAGVFDWQMDYGNKFFIDNNLYFDSSASAKFWHRVSGNMVTTEGIKAWQDILRSAGGYSYLGGKDEHSIEADPQFVYGPTYPWGYNPLWNYTLQSTSPAIDAGRPVAQAVNSASNATTLHVDDAYFFFDGFGITNGDTVIIGQGDPVRIQSIDYPNNIITLAETRSWNAGNSVTLAYEGKNPDIGAFEFPSGGPVKVLPTVPILSAPQTGSPGHGASVTLTWSGDPQTLFYDLEIDTTGGFANGRVTVSGILSSSYQAQGLRGTTTYFWRVRAINQAGPSEWSGAFTFSTGVIDSVPGVPTLNTPANGSADNATNPRLSWQSVARATSYDLQVSGSADFAALQSDLRGIQNTAYQLQELNGSTTYFWRVRAVNNVGAGNWSESFSFSTAAIVSVPGVPVLHAPVNGATNFSTSPRLSWSPVVEASSYDLQVSPRSDFATLHTGQQAIEDTTFQIHGLEGSTAYFWRVRASNQVGPGNWSEPFSFTTSAIDSLPGAPVLTSPANGASPTTIDPLLMWNPVFRATAYQLQISKTASFVTPVLDSLGLKATDFQVRSLDDSTTYFWRVRASNQLGAGNWSQTFSFTTVLIDSAPLAPTLRTPTNGLQGISTNILLSWNAASRAAAYHLQVARTAAFLSPDLDQVNLVETQFQAQGLSNSTTYFWRVRASNSFGTGSWSTIFSFTTVSVDSALRAPILNTPLNGTQGTPVDPVLTWNSVPRATEYWVQIARTADFQALDLNRQGIVGTQHRAQGLIRNTTYYWRVRAVNTGGPSTWSATFVFTTALIDSTPAVPTLNIPAAGATGVSTNPTLIWSNVPGATAYRIQVATEPSFSAIWLDSAVTGDNACTLDGLRNSTEYFWHVFSSNGFRTSGWSPTYSFTTFDLPVVPRANVVNNSGFENGTQAWVLEGNGLFTVEAPGFRKAASAKIYVVDTTSDLSLYQDSLILKPDSTYRLSFAAYSTKGNDLAVSVVKSGDKSMTYGLKAKRQQLEKTWSIFTIDFTPSNISSPVNNVRLEFSFGGLGSPGSVYSIDQILLRTIDPSNPPPVETIPISYALEQNFPNPFNPSTTIRYSIPSDGYVSLKVYDVLGRLVVTLIDGFMPAGTHNARLSMEGFASGVYVYQLQAGPTRTPTFRETKKLVFIR